MEGKRRGLSALARDIVRRAVWSLLRQPRRQMAVLLGLSYSTNSQAVGLRVVRRRFAVGSAPAASSRPSWSSRGLPRLHAVPQLHPHLLEHPQLLQRPGEYPCALPRPRRVAVSGRQSAPAAQEVILQLLFNTMRLFCEKKRQEHMRVGARRAGVLAPMLPELRCRHLLRLYDGRFLPLTMAARHFERSGSSRPVLFGSWCT
jgi:hypothetical protein